MLDEDVRDGEGATLAHQEGEPRTTARLRPSACTKRHPPPMSDFLMRGGPFFFGMSPA